MTKPLYSIRNFSTHPDCIPWSQDAEYFEVSKVNHQDTAIPSSKHNTSKRNAHKHKSTAEYKWAQQVAVATITSNKHQFEKHTKAQVSNNTVFPEWNTSPFEN